MSQEVAQIGGAAEIYRPNCRLSGCCFGQLAEISLTS